MPVALGLFALGVIWLYSGLVGKSVADIFSGDSGGGLNPSGGGGPFANLMTTLTSVSTPDPTTTNDLLTPTPQVKGGNWTAPTGGAHSFKGPHASLLNTLAGVAQNHYHLTITATTNGNHVANSYHYAGRAFDAAGNDTDMREFDKYVKDHYQSQTLELIHNPGPYNIKNGQTVNGSQVYAEVWAGHTNHVHVAA